MDETRTHFGNAEADFNSHIDCIKGVLFTGIAALCLGYTGFFCLQDIVATNFNVTYPRKFNIMVSTLAAVFISQQITKYAVNECDNNLKTKMEKKEADSSNARVRKGLQRWIHNK